MFAACESEYAFWKNLAKNTLEQDDDMLLSVEHDGMQEMLES